MHEVHDLNTEAWDEWVEYRHKEKRIKIGKIAERKQQKLLRQYPPPVQQSMVDTSIMNSYQGLFPPKNYRPTATEQANANAARQVAMYSDIAGLLE